MKEWIKRSWYHSYSYGSKRSKVKVKAGSKRSRKKKANRYDEDDEVIEYNFVSSKDKVNK